jgi:dihydroorotase-like cyclic amidohydrolase
MSGADLDLVVRARRAVMDGALRPCSVGVRDGRIVAVAAYEAALDAAEITDLAADEVADMCAFAPGDSFVVDAAALRHRNAVSAYDGKRLAGVVRRTWLRGRPCPSPADGEPTGRLIRRTEP